MKCAITWKYWWQNIFNADPQQRLFYQVDTQSLTPFQHRQLRDHHPVKRALTYPEMRLKAKAEYENRHR